MSAEIIREAIIRLGVELSKDSIDFKPYAEEINRATESIQKHNKVVGDAAGELQSAELAQRAYTEASIQASEANLRASEAAKQVGEGAFGAARGIAFLAASSEESEAAMLRNIAAAQGAFDIYKGGVDIIRGVSEANKALAAASAAVTVAEAAKAGAITATGAAATAATPKLAAMNLALGPVGVGVAALTAAAAGGVALWRAYGDAGESALDRINRETDEAIRKQLQLTDIQNAIAEANDRMRSVLSPVEQVALIDAELAGLGPVQTADELTADFRGDRQSAASARAARQAALNRNKGRRDRGSVPFSLAEVEQLDAEASRSGRLAARNLQNEVDEMLRRFTLEQERASITIRQREDSLRDIDRQLRRFKDDPAAALQGDTSALQRSRQAIEAEVLDMQENLQDTFRSLNSTIIEIKRKQQELDAFQSAAAAAAGL